MLTGVRNLENRCNGWGNGCKCKPRLTNQGRGSHCGAKMENILQTIQDVALADSAIHGTGLFTTRDRAKGEILTVLDGQVVPHNNDLDFLMTYEWNAISESHILLRPVWTLYGYINHAKQPVLSFNLLHQTLCLSRDIKAGTELTLDYCEHGIPDIYLNSEHGRYLR